jgi:hypothetical protein
MQEEMEEVMEKGSWEREQFKAEHRRKPKRKPEEVETHPAGWVRQPKKLRRMETEETAQEEEFDIQGNWRRRGASELDSSGGDWKRTESES